jgi:arylsulfatase A-like enzyme
MAGLPSRRRRLAGALALLGVALAAGCGFGGDKDHSRHELEVVKSPPVDPELAEAADGPNFLLILADDQAQNSFKPRYMPNTFREIVNPGSDLVNGIASPPLCCPDRAGIITGDYSHNNGVFVNQPGYKDLLHPENVLPIWLQRAGYYTGFVGKYLNNYSRAAGNNPPPGYEYANFVAGHVGYYDYKLEDGKTVREYGTDPSDYETKVLTKSSVDFLHRAADQPNPFFLWTAFYSPHIQRKEETKQCPDAPQPPDMAAYRKAKNAKLPKDPSYNERDVSDKESAIAGRAPMTKKEIAYTEQSFRCTVAAIGALDEAIGKLVKTLRADGELDDTVILYASDNGYFFGEHRVPKGKGRVYEPSINVPMAIRVPPKYRSADQPRNVLNPVSNQDVAPTFLDLAGGLPSCYSDDKCRVVDGHSMMPLLGGDGTWPHDRGVLVDANKYAAIRTKRWVYEELEDGQREMFDLKNDPYELKNVARDKAYAADRKRLARRLGRLKECRGAEGVDTPTGVPLCE